MIANNTASLFRREDASHEAMIIACMSKTSKIEFDDLLPRVKQTGWVWMSGQRVKREA